MCFFFLLVFREPILLTIFVSPTQTIHLTKSSQNKSVQQIRAEFVVTDFTLSCLFVFFFYYYTCLVENNKIVVHHFFEI
jgi:hypothetical protein